MGENELFDNGIWEYEFGPVNGIDFAAKLTNRRSGDVAAEAQDVYACGELTAERIDALRAGKGKLSAKEEEALSRVLGIPKECLFEMSVGERDALVNTGMWKYTIFDDGERAIYKTEKSEFWEERSMNHKWCPKERDEIHYLPELARSFPEQLEFLRRAENEALLRIEGICHEGAPDKQVAGKKHALSYLRLLAHMMEYRTGEDTRERSNQVDVLCYALAKVFGCEFSNVPEGCMETTSIANAAQIDELAGMIREFLQTKLNPGWFMEVKGKEPVKPGEPLSESGEARSEEAASEAGEPEEDFGEDEEPAELSAEYVCTEKEAEKRLKKMKFTGEELERHANTMWNWDWHGVRLMSSMVVAEPQICSVWLSKEDALLREYLLEQIRLGKIA